MAWSPSQDLNCLQNTETARTRSGSARTTTTNVMRLSLLLFLFFEVSYSNPTSQLPEGLIQRGSIQNGHIYLNRDVLQKYIKCILPSSGNVSPYQEEEDSTDVGCENTQTQQNDQPSSKYQHVTQYPKKYQWEEEEDALKKQSMQQNINSQHVYKRKADENVNANQNVNQQPQNVPPLSQIVYQQMRPLTGQQGTYQRIQQHFASNPQTFRGEQEQEYESQARQQVIQQQKLLQQQQQEMLLKQQRQQQLLLENQQQHQQHLQQQQFRQQQQQQQQLHQVQQQQQLQQQQQQYEQSESHQPPTYLPINANKQHEKFLQQRQETQQDPKVQGPEGSQSFQENIRRVFPVPPPYLYQLQRQQRHSSTPYQPIYLPLQRLARHQPNGGELRRPPFYFGQPHQPLPPTPPSERGAEEEEKQTPEAEPQPQPPQVMRTVQTGLIRMAQSQN